MASPFKRPAFYVPEPQRAQLDRLSKADLMELVWDLGMMTSDNFGTDAESADHILSTIRESHVALKAAGYQGSSTLR